MESYLKKTKKETHRYREQTGGCQRQRVGKMDEDGQKANPSSYNTKSWRGNAQTHAARWLQMTILCCTFESSKKINLKSSHQKIKKIAIVCNRWSLDLLWGSFQDTHTSYRGTPDTNVMLCVNYISTFKKENNHMYQHIQNKTKTSVGSQCFASVLPMVLAPSTIVPSVLVSPGDLNTQRTSALFPGRSVDTGVAMWQPSQLACSENRVAFCFFPSPHTPKIE